MENIGHSEHVKEELKRSVRRCLSNIFEKKQMEIGEGDEQWTEVSPPSRVKSCINIIQPQKE